MLRWEGFGIGWVGGLKRAVGMGALPEQSGSGGLQSTCQKFLDMQHADPAESGGHGPWKNSVLPSAALSLSGGGAWDSLGLAFPRKIALKTDACKRMVPVVNCAA